MANDPFLGMLGLARRAGKLAFGDELVREMCLDKKARAVFTAVDAGASTAKKAAFYAQSANAPLISLPYGKDELGMAIGKNGCAVCAVSDIGIAAAALQKLAVMRSEYADMAVQLAEKNTRIQSRKGKKKRRDKGAEAETPRRPSETGRAGSRQRSSASHRMGDKNKPVHGAARRADKTARLSRKHSDTPRAKRALDRKSPRSKAKR